MCVHIYVYAESQESSNMYFCFRWLLILFKREFSFPEIMRIWEVSWNACLCEVRIWWLIDNLPSSEHTFLGFYASSWCCLAAKFQFYILISKSFLLAILYAQYIVMHCNH